MVREPDHLIEAFVAAGATAVGVHVEACTHLHRTLTLIRKLGARLRGAESATPASAIQPAGSSSTVLVMTVNPGFGGQRFIAETLPKIREIRPGSTRAVATPTSWSTAASAPTRSRRSPCTARACS
jgi:ribulose-phosphate 3-epimerase